MEKLKNIWLKINEVQKELEELVDLNQVNKVYDQLKSAEENRKKYLPWATLAIVVTMSFLARICYIQSEDFGVAQIAGLFLIFVGSVIIVYLPQSIRVPLNKFEYDQSSLSFYTTVRNTILTQRKYYLSSIIALFGCLTIGLYLMIFGFQSPFPGEGFTGAFLGFMIGLAGFCIPFSIRDFDQYYKDILLRIERFIGE